MNMEQSKQVISGPQANIELEGDCVNVMRQLRYIGCQPPIPDVYAENNL